jgi:pimeloyl-ACP methyl ester carboxylesterase
VLYTRLMKRLEAAHDSDAITRLKSVGPPPYKSEHDLDVERQIQGRFETPAEQHLYSTMLPVVLFAPDVSLGDIYAFTRGQQFAGEALYRELLGFDARKLGTHFDIPVFIFNGDQDLTTPADLAKTWFDTLDAPKKEFVILKGGGHSAVQIMPEVFLAELNARVRPLAK